MNVENAWRYIRLCILFISAPHMHMIENDLLCRKMAAAHTQYNNYLFIYKLQDPIPYAHEYL